MTLSRRISLVVLAVVAATSMSLAVLSAITGRSSALREVDERLTALRTAATQDGADPVDTLLRNLLTLPTNFVAALSVDDEALVDLIGSDDPNALRLDAIEPEALRKAVEAPHTINGDEPIRISAIDLGAGEWLVFGEGVGDIANAFTNQLLINGALAIAVALLGGLFTLQVTRRSLAPLRDIVRYSQSVAAGHLATNLPADATTIEVRELQASIGTMVGELKSAAEVKTKSEQEMREFLADVAHELRTPLTTVRAYAEVLSSQQHVDAEVRQRAQDRIAHESQRMTRLIDDLLLLARLASAPSSTRSALDVGSVITAHFNDLGILDPLRPVKVDVVPCEISADPALMDRLFANLASNIHRHTPSNAHVVVRCESRDGIVTCTIDDAGPGIDDGQMQLLSQGAQRFGALRSGDQHGTGLGLHLVTSIARLHGGGARFERSPLGGLRVTITLASTPAHTA
ncbi:MAG: hypothetical protein RLZZ284_442 [Actinomycetota bacterium]